MTLHSDGNQSHMTDTKLMVHGRDTPYAYKDRNTLLQVGGAKPNQLAARMAKWQAI